MSVRLFGRGHRGVGALIIFALAIVLSGCGKTPPAEGFRYELLPVADLPGWDDDSHAEALATFRRSCPNLLAKPADQPLSGKPYAGFGSDWHSVCLEAGITGPDNAKRFFETSFDALALFDGEQSDGLFTGYFEPLLRGSRQPDHRYPYPLHGPPNDIVEVDLRAFGLDQGPRRLIGRSVGGRILPYFDRAQINAGALADRAPVVAWVEDPIDRFFLHIQGSGKVLLDDGETIRVGYAGQNGHSYRAIGRDLIEWGEVPAEEMSMQRIRSWLEAAPADRAEALMTSNGSYIFFTELEGLDPDLGSLGASGVQLTPKRSLAVDPAYVPLGSPVWLRAADVPYPERDEEFSALMVAQDTGGAIKGVVRGDVFWGAGELAAHVAGHMKSRGQFFLFVPKMARRLG
ncbi:MAG: murein transglycosylase A [Geminicoccaceae bacterium]